jgi:amidase
MCGLVGLKPTRGRITFGPDRDESGLSVQHVVTRSVRDTAALLDVGQGPGPGDMAVAPPPRRPYVEELTVRPTGLRIGMLDCNPGGTLHPDCEAAVRQAGTLLDQLGHAVSGDLPAMDPQSVRTFMARWAVNARLHLVGLGRVLGRDVTRDDVEPLTWAMASAADGLTALDFAQAVQAGVAFTRQLGAFWVDHDLLLTPTLGEPPPLVGELVPPADDPFATQAHTASLVPFSTHFNVTGQPAVSLPLHVNEAGLPIGVQLVAAYGREDLLIQVAAQLEEAAPWAGRRPAL